MTQTTPWRIALLLTAVASILGVTGLAADWSAGMQHLAEDLLQPGTDRHDDIVVVEIDRRTLSEVGESWPWSRGRHAELLDRIADGEPKVIILDVLFVDSRDDGVLAAAIERSPIVLASALTLKATSGPLLVVEEVLPTPVLAEAAAAIGHANVTLTPDRGVVRALPFYAVDDRGLVQPSLVLAALGVIENSQQYIERPDGIQIGERFVPLDGGDLRINWTAGLDTATGATLSAIDVIEGRVAAAEFAGKTVVVGVTEPTLGDLHLVPADKSGSTSGLSIHANALNTVLTDSYLADASLSGQIGLIVLLCALGAVGFAWLALRWAFLGGAVGIVAVITFSSWRFHAAGELWNIIWPSVAVATVAILGSSARYAGEIRHRRRATALFASYVPAGTLDQLADPAVLDRAVTGERLAVTVLFCDLRNFTLTAASLTADKVRRLLEIYYSYATEIIGAHDGTVMQFVGDEVFAVFGAPIPAPDDAERALDCARALSGNIAKLDRRLTDDGLPTTRFGIGLHRGEVIAAHVGGSTHRQYSVIGDPVNIGNRLCGQAGPGEIVASDAALAELRTSGMEQIDHLDLKGVDRQIPAWRIR